MNESSLIESKEKIQERASLWISKMDRGLNQEEQRALDSWLNESDVHAETLMDLAALWDNLSSLSRFR